MRKRPWWTIGWRNLGRHRRRSALTALGLGLGFFSIVVLVGLSRGLIAEMIDGGTGLVEGQLQVHAADFLPERSIYDIVADGDAALVDAVIAVVERDPAVTAVVSRVFGGGLISSGTNTVATAFVGADPEREAAVARWVRSVVEGRLPQLGRNEVLIGAEVARRLDAGPGDEVVLVAPAADGSLGNDLYSISGVFESGLAELDAAYALLPIDVMRFLLALEPGAVHEIAARIVDPWEAVAAATRIEAGLRAAGADDDVRPWTVFRPEMVEYANLASASYWVIIVIVFGMAIFGVANTMLMSTFERRFEFAVMLALGTVPSVIVRAVVSEALALGVIGLIGGAIVTAPVLVWWHHWPLDIANVLGGFTMAGGFVRPVLRVEYPWATIGQAAVALLLTAVIAALYPSYRAARVPPADTLAGR